MGRYGCDPFSELSVSGSSDSEDEKADRVPPAKKQATGNGATDATSSPRGHATVSTSPATRLSPKETPRMSASAARAAGAWIKNWQDAGYPKALLQQVSQFRNSPAPSSGGAIAGLEKIPIPNAVHKAMALAGGSNGSSSSSMPGSQPVYLVSYIQHGQYVDFEHKVLGAYSNIAAATDHLLGYIPSYNGMTHILEMKDWQRGLNAESYHSGVFWDVNLDGCVTIVLKEEKGTQRIDIKVQEVRDKPPPTLERPDTTVLYPDVPNDWVTDF
ncbi:hypothetical protein PG993_008581 [Apiospora rasikravindrae]|uniref:Uncharacterized protein n=1 Tax=Apiospora rasikravindrae TaxID=990691 RepID=A0ABR1T0S5_9PEZI